jgi:cyclic pyranopterin phosphate synthase
MPTEPHHEPPARPSPGSAPELSHLGPPDPAGHRAARMVDTGGKPLTRRTALARASVVFPPGLLGAILAGQGPKGPIEEVARLAGILAAKRTGELIPLCHPLGLDHVEVTLVRVGEDTLEVRCSAATEGRTGVEMEAMTGATIAALTVYDMTKAASKGVRIERVELLEKTGGKHGTWRPEGR